MARPRKNPLAPPSQLIAWAQVLGEALGRGVAAGVSTGLAASGLPIKRGRGRPPKLLVGAVPPERRCKIEGCVRPMRSKGLCSAHYQAARRKAPKK
ncbi:MAG: hypothetical protein ACOZIN_06400 [Myxococcota bacterium]